MNLAKLKAKHQRQLDALRKRQTEEMLSATGRAAPHAPFVAGRRARPGEVDALLQKARSTVNGGLWSMFGARCDGAPSKGGDPV